MACNEELYVDIKTLAEAWCPPNATKDEILTKIQSIKKSIQRGKFESARKAEAKQVNGKSVGDGGFIWQINIADPAIPSDVRIKYFEKYFPITEQAALPGATTDNLPVALPKSLTVPDSKELNSKQEKILTARYQIIKMIETRKPGKPLMETIQNIVDAINNGTNERLVNIAAIANAKKGEGRGLSVPTIMRWRADYLKTGKKQNALAPIKGDKLPQREVAAWIAEYTPPASAAVLPLCIPPWLPYVLDEYRRPQKPSIHQALRKLSASMPPDIKIPSYDQIRRVFKKIPAVYREKNRKTGAEYNSLLGFVERDASMNAPMSICQVDGHSFKAYVAHPVTGAHFHPEVCGVICMTTKVLVGWSAGLAESTQTVGDAFRHACTVTTQKPWGGIPAILEADRGAGNMAKANSDEYIGLYARLGTTFIPPERGGNPQAHGAIERSNQSIWIRAAKELPTYTGKDMDRGAKRLVYDRLERDLKAIKKADKLGMVTKTSEVLLSWSEFLEYLEQSVARYNNTPHRALPKINAPQPHDPHGPSVSRNMTPLECWADYMAQGFTPQLPDEADETILKKLFMPHEIVTVKREKFTLNGNSYHSLDLHEWHNSQVIAVYDIHNPHNVTVLDLDEHYICEAKWNGNRVHARPVSKVEQATMQRQTRRVKNAERHIDMMNAEADSKAIEIRSEHIELPAEVLEYEAREEQKNIVRMNAPKLFADEHEIYDDIRRLEKEGLASAYELQWAADKDASFGVRGGVGLFKTDQYCHGRYEAENTIEKAASATNTNGL